MKIAIDTTPLEGGHKLRGTGVYTHNLISALQKYENQFSYIFFTRKQKIPKNVDLVHYPYFDPFFLTLPLKKPLQTVVTVHDLIPLAYKEHFSVGFRGRVKWLIQKYSLGTAARIITDSHSSQHDISRFTTIPRERIDVVYLAPGEPTATVITKEFNVSKTKIPNKYVLYVGDINWNKNVPGLLQAFSILKKRSDYHDFQLVLVGRAFNERSTSESIEIHKLIDSLDLADAIHMPGAVVSSDIVKLYKNASVYIQPSFAEGFGLPVLEAMRYGCPVICARGTSLDEIAGPAVRVDPYDPADMAQGIVVGLKKGTTMKREQSEWVSQFSWKRVARETVVSYEKALERV